MLVYRPHYALKNVFQPYDRIEMSVNGRIEGYYSVFDFFVYNWVSVENSSSNANKDHFVSFEFPNIDSATIKITDIQHNT